MTETILPCKLCGSEARVAYIEIAEDDEGKYTYEMYYVKCCTEYCDNWYLPDHELDYSEEAAIDTWNRLQSEDRDVEDTE